MLSSSCGGTSQKKQVQILGMRPNCTPQPSHQLNGILQGLGIRPCGGELSADGQSERAGAGGIGEWGTPNICAHVHTRLL